MRIIFILLFAPIFLLGQDSPFKNLLEKTKKLLPSKYGTHLPIYYASSTSEQTYLGYNNIQANPYFPFEGMVPFGVAAKKYVFEKKKNHVFISSVVNGQLGHREENNTFFQGTRVSLLNADFFLNLGYEYNLTTKWTLRLMAFHRSTHLGDDLVLLNGITNSNYWGTDESSYEELNFLIDRSLIGNAIHVYGSSGLNLRQSSPRKNWTFTAGGQFTPRKLPIPIIKRMFFAIDYNWAENNNYALSKNIAFGYALKSDGSIRLMASYFNGNIQYSRYESSLKQAYWRIGIYFDSILK